METKAERAKAHRAVRQELHMGRMVRPDACTKCGENPGPAKDGRSQIHGHHHKGYDFPLDVEWLCVHCHRKDTPLPIGSRNAMAKLTAESALYIRQSTESTRSLAERFSVSTKAIMRVRNGQYWSHLQSKGGEP